MVNATTDWYLVDGMNTQGKKTRVVCEAENSMQAMEFARDYGLRRIGNWRVSSDNHKSDRVIDLSLRHVK